MSKFVRRAGITTAAAALGIIGAVAPASAHYLTIYQGNDWGRIDSGHNYIYTHDTECDGHATSTIYVYSSSGNVHTDELYDANGCSSGTSSVFVGAVTVSIMKVCEHTGSAGTPTLYCTEWKDA